ncbi:glycosyltransferase family 32 protein [Agathobacter sp.]
MIPKVIHYCWFGNGEMPDKDKKNIEGWRKLNPDYQIIRWDESNYDVNKNAYMSECYSIPKWGFVPDYARTDIIYNYGGFYFDTDVELKKPLDSLLDEKCIMGFEKSDSVNHGHGFAAEKGNAIIKELLDFYDSIHFINADGSLNITASPVYITQLLIKHGLKLNGKEQVIDGVHVYPTEYFCPKDYLTGEIKLTTNTISIHHFNLSWMNNEDIQKMKEVGKLSKKYGVFFARNVVDVKYAYVDGGIKEIILMLIRKVKKKVS